MSKFIQVNKLYYSNSKYIHSKFDSLLNTDEIVEVTPRDIDENTNNVFQNQNACRVLMKNGDSFYILGNFSDIKAKMGLI